MHSLVMLAKQQKLQLVLSSSYSISNLASLARFKL